MDQVTVFINLGAVGVILYLFITDKLQTKATLDREIKRADTATEAAQENAAALKENASAILAISTEVKNLRDEVRALRRGLNEGNA